MVGVLALQGDFALHLAALARLGVPAREVRTPRDLEGLRALVLPGGESTTMLTLMAGTGMEAAVREFYHGGGAVFGTCAGLILLARRVSGPEQRSLGLLDGDVERNAYGRQRDSFETALDFGNGTPLRGVFIRAPRLVRIGPGVEVLARVGDDPVLVREGRLLAATFHPELTEDTRIHRYFLEEVAGQAGNGSRREDARVAG
jgi:pyridoxal 5'-phosphate synthase pdxT subunit